MRAEHDRRAFKHGRQRAGVDSSHASTRNLFLVEVAHNPRQYYLSISAFMIPYLKTITLAVKLLTLVLEGTLNPFFIFLSTVITISRTLHRPKQKFHAINDNSL